MPILLGGKVADGAWDALTDYYKKETDKKDKTPQKGPPEATPAQAAAAAARDEKANTVARSPAANPRSLSNKGFSDAPLVMHTDDKTGEKILGRVDPETGEFQPEIQK
jgi:hypothetical protein